MTDYAKITVSVAYSEDSDYGPPYVIYPEPETATYTPSECGGDRKISVATTPGTTIDLSNLGSPAQLLLKNTDSENPVTLSWDDSDANSNTQKIPAGGIFVIPDVDPSATITAVASTSAVVCRVKAFA